MHDLNNTGRLNKNRQIVDSFKDRFLMNFYQEGLGSIGVEFKPIYLLTQSSTGLSFDQNGIEALIRWNDENNVISPMDIISAVDGQAELMLPITRKVLHSALNATQSWLQEQPKFVLSINASTNEIGIDGYADLIYRLVKKFEVRTSQIEVSFPIEALRTGKGVKQIKQLKDMGFLLQVSTVKGQLLNDFEFDQANDYQVDSIALEKGRAIFLPKEFKEYTQIMKLLQS